MSGARDTGTSSKTGGAAIPTAPSAPKKHYATHGGSSGGSHKSGSHTSSTKSGSGSGSASASSNAQAYQNGQNKKYGHQYVRQAQNLEGQAKALIYALNRGFKQNLMQQLGDVSQTLHQQQVVLNEGYRRRLGELVGANDDNTKGAAEQTDINRGNLVRERNSAVAEAMSQGAGESDQLQTQLMSLRNWQANQADVNRSYLDSLRSINSSLADLNVDTKTGLVNNVIQANADKEQLWTNYYNQKSQTYTQLGNVRGQQADYYDQAKTMGVKGPAGKAQNQAAAAFMAAAHENGKSWDNPGVGKKLMAWHGHGDFQASHSASHLGSQPTVDLGAKPEGATLRKW